MRDRVEAVGGEFDATYRARERHRDFRLGARPERGARDPLGELNAQMTPDDTQFGGLPCLLHCFGFLVVLVLGLRCASGARMSVGATCDG
jgi:hypothetical protein